MDPVVISRCFRCRRCHAPVSADVVEVADPGPAAGGAGTAPVNLPPTMATAGTWALTHRPAFAPGWIAGRSAYPPSVAHPQPAVLLDEDDLAPGVATDAQAAVGCCGIDGHEGPNLTCPGCGALVGTVFDDCWTPAESRLDPAAVHLAPGQAIGPEVPFR